MLEVLKRYIQELPSFSDGSAWDWRADHIYPPWEPCYLVWDRHPTPPSFLFLQISLLSFSSGLISPLRGQPPVTQSTRYAQGFTRNQQEERNYNPDCPNFKPLPLSAEPFLPSSSFGAANPLCFPLIQSHPVMKAPAGFLIGPWMEQGLPTKTLWWTGPTGAAWVDERSYKQLQRSSVFSQSLFQVQIVSLQHVKAFHEINAKNFHFYGIFRLYFIFQAAVGLNRSHNACDAPNTKRNYKMWQFLKCVSCCITNSQCCRLN